MACSRSDPRWRRGAAAAACAAALLAPPAHAVDGPRLHYMLHCMGCHLDDGSGMPNKGIPSMKGSVGHFLRLPEGRALIVQVPGVMNTPLDDRQIAELMNWMLKEVGGDSVPAGSTPYTTEEVRALRATRPADVMSLRARTAERLRTLGWPVE